MNKSFQIKTRKNKKDGVQIVSIEGDLSLKNAPDMLKKFQSLKPAEKKVLIQLSNVVNIDISFIQLCLALEKKFEGELVKVTIEADLPDDLKSILQHTGFRQFAA